MTTEPKSQYDYAAREAYQSYEVAEDYERDRFSSLLGRYRYRREHKAVIDLVDRLPEGVTFADCPCGIGRWWPVLARRANKIIAMDISAGMLKYAGEQAVDFPLDVEVREGDAEGHAEALDSTRAGLRHASVSGFLERCRGAVAAWLEGGGRGGRSGPAASHDYRTESGHKKACGTPWVLARSEGAAASGSKSLWR